MDSSDNNHRHSQRLPEKAEVILDGAMREFLEFGYAATSMDRVAAIAGVSKATVYRHFQNKEALFTALIQQLAQTQFQPVFNLKQAEQLQSEPRLVLQTLASKMLDNIMENEQMLTFMRLLIGESGRFPELAHIFIRSLEKPGIEAVSQYLAAQSKLQLADPEVSARIFIGTLVHFVLLQKVLHGQESLPMERDRLVNGLLDLICLRSGDRLNPTGI
ncbi:TetR/AcrR family transcriptional regulator [Oculatella sp. LEGE 06141]|uniref:TetR/AcrR family transcriptional regulator n=1 Tax=Oculatella sp. LEGE 06141 TaxID=1828648 RepID=UPI001880CCF4|nr:TetR/AcrR family transcriptional regulator [Oculatella sp. LEGE 06141]MBE9182016.1 TetR/AcrR family transcriptional regulator [Oculatella sp. LEGE 06141]